MIFFFRDNKLDIFKYYYKHSVVRMLYCFEYYPRNVFKTFRFDEMINNKLLYEKNKTKSIIFILSIWYILISHDIVFLFYVHPVGISLCNRSRHPAITFGANLAAKNPFVVDGQIAPKVTRHFIILWSAQ